MLYQPKYCCNCSEKIERTNRRLWSSRRFCEVCETDFGFQEWTPRIIVIVGLVFGIVGFAGFFQSAEKPAKIASLRSPQPAGETKGETKKDSAINQSADDKAATHSSVRTPLQNSANTTEPTRHQNASLAKQTAPSKASENQTSVAEATYFCGAATKKGNPCSRRVKGGGRCWQHVGQPAVLPPEKLIASR